MTYERAFAYVICCAIKFCLKFICRWILNSNSFVWRLGLDVLIGWPVKLCDCKLEAFIWIIIVMNGCGCGLMETLITVSSLCSISFVSFVFASSDRRASHQVQPFKSHLRILRTIIPIDWEKCSILFHVSPTPRPAATDLCMNHINS